MIRSALAGGLILLSVASFGSESKPGAEASAGGDNSYRYLSRLLDQKVHELDWGGAKLGLVVVDPEHDMPVIDLDGDRPLAASSASKIYTALAAAELLGKDFTFKTAFEARGEIKKKTLAGSIILRGTGDPTISATWAGSAEGLYETFDHWIGLLKAKKIKAFEGDIFVDATAFDAQPFALGWPVESSVADLPEVSALCLNDNCVDILWEPAKPKQAGKIASFHLLPQVPDFIFFSNNVRIELKPRSARRYSRQAGSNVITMDGQLEPGTRPVDRASILDPAIFFGRAFKARLEEKGIRVTGEVIAGKGDPAGDPIAEDVRSSPPLEEILTRMIREDRHLDAETVLKTIGARATREPGSFTAGAEALMKFARDKRLPASGLVLMDGSGLSSLNRASPRQLVAALDQIRNRPGLAWLRGGFAETEKTGVLRERFRPDPKLPEAAPVKAQAIAGGRDGAQAMAGWVGTRGGATMQFAFLVSGSKLSLEELEQRIDAVISLIGQSPIK